MSDDTQLTGLGRRERTGTEKRKDGMVQITRMLPRSTYIENQGAIPDNVLTPELMAMGMEDSYGGVWSRTEILSHRDRSLATVGMMIGAGNVGNQFELGYHAPGAVYNGVTVEEIEAIAIHARAYVGSPASAWANQSMAKALAEHGLIEFPRPAINLERRDRTGSEKRMIARAVLREMKPDSPLLDIGEDIRTDVFAGELELMMLENLYYDLWARTDVLDRRSRSIVTVGMLIGLSNHAALREHIPVALRNGVSVPELEEIVYQAATYLGYPTGRRGSHHDRCRPRGRGSRELAEPDQPGRVPGGRHAERNPEAGFLSASRSRHQQIESRGQSWLTRKGESNDYQRRRVPGPLRQARSGLPGELRAGHH